MKFFDKLPQTTFESSIGSFIIADFFTYLDVEKATVPTSNITVDDKSTLPEAAYFIYNDPNNFWAFVAANKTINPFDLLAPNISLYTKNNTSKVNLLLYQGVCGGTGAIFPAGTLLVPYSGNTGATWGMGSTGNFDLYGPMALVQQTSYYDGNMILTTQVGATYDFIQINNTSDHVGAVYPNGADYDWETNLYTGNKKAATSAVSALINSTDGKTISRETTSSITTTDDLIDESPALGGTYAAYTNIQIVDRESKTILAYVPSRLGTIQASFVTAATS